jgi:hypothetical protein
MIVAYQHKPSIVRRAMYYSHRVLVMPSLRAVVVRGLQWWIGKPAIANVPARTALQAVNENGIALLDNVFTASQCDDILAYLADKPVYDKGMSVDRAFAPEQRADMSFGIHLLEHVVDCPHIMELVASPEIVQLAADYLGCNPTLSTMGVQWSFPTAVPGIAQQFHRDSEDWKFLRFLVYLTDVEEGCGPHVYVKGSHRDKLPLRLCFYQPEEISKQYGNDRVTKIYAPRGTGIAADTCGIHKGELPTAKPRLLLTFTYAILPNPLSKYRAITSRHSASLTNYTTRLFLR